MSAEADLILQGISQLSIDELLIVKAKVDQEIRQKKVTPNQQYNAEISNQSDKIQSLIYQRTPEEIEAFLAALFTPEELAEIGKRDFTRKDLGSKSLSEMVIEDREDSL